MSGDVHIIREFGIQRENEERRDGGCAIVFDPATKRYAVGKKTNGGFLMLFGGGVSAQEDIQEGVLREVVEESGLYDFLYVEKIGEAIAHYYNSAKNVNRVTHVTCFLVILKGSDVKDVQLEEHEKFKLSWATAKDIISNWEAGNANKDVDHWIYFFKKAIQRAAVLGHDTTNRTD